MLKVHKLEKSFGGVQAVQDCDFTVEEGSITGLIGPNGAGKTTVFNLITGLIPADKGTITFRGAPLTDLVPHEIFNLGIARTFQMLRIFPKLTCMENLLVAHPGRDEHAFDSIFRRKLLRDEEKGREERVREHLRFVGLTQYANTPAGDLSYGQQKLLDIARCLATEADLLLLDEPVAGVNPILREKISELLVGLKKKGRTILLIEHDMKFVMKLSDKVVVMDHGEEIAIGTPKQVRRNKRVQEAYFG